MLNSLTENEALLLPDWELVARECEVTESQIVTPGAELDPDAFTVNEGDLIDCLVTNDSATEVGGIQVLPLTGSPVEIALKSALWLLGLGELLLLATRLRRRRPAHARLTR